MQNLQMTRAVRLANFISGGAPSSAVASSLSDPGLASSFSELLRRRGSVESRNAVSAAVAGMTAIELANSLASGDFFSPYIVASSTAIASIAASSAAMFIVLSSAVSVSAINSSPTAKTAIIGSTALAKGSVPAMTSNTAPSGIASAKDFYDASYAAWAAFDKNTSTYWNSLDAARSGDDWIAYQFPADMCVTSVSISAFSAAYAPKDCRIEFSDDGVSFYTANTIIAAENDLVQSFYFLSAGFHKHWRIAMLNIYGGQNYIVLTAVDFAGFVKP